jgi:hypothetical protein
MTSKEARLHPEKLAFNEYKKAAEGGVAKYAILKDGIVLTFKDNRNYYLYTFIEPGIEHVEQMIERAENGEKLNTYVTQVVKDKYADRWIPDLIENGVL